MFICSFLIALGVLVPIVVVGGITKGIAIKREKERNKKQKENYSLHELASASSIFFPGLHSTHKFKQRVVQNLGDLAKLVFLSLSQTIHFITSLVTPPCNNQIQ